MGAPSNTCRLSGTAAIAVIGPPASASNAMPVTPTPLGLPAASNETTATDVEYVAAATNRPAADPSLGGGTASRLGPKSLSAG